MHSNKHIIVLHGKIKEGAGKDEEDTLVQALTVSQSLKRLGYSTETIEAGLNLDELRTKLIAAKPAAVFYLVEAIEGMGRYISMPALVLDELGIPYTGNSSDAITLTSSKTMAKLILQGKELPTPSSCSALKALQNPSVVPLPSIVKHSIEHASIGLSQDSVVFTQEKIIAKLNSLSAPDRELFFLEEFIDGREFNISVLETPNGPVVLPHAEILFKGYGKDRIKIVDYSAKWEEDSYAYSNTPRSFDFEEYDKPLLNSLTELSLKTWEAFSLSGYVRVDFRVSNSGEPFILEINTNPCISPDAGFTAAAAKAGYTFDSLIDNLIKCALS